MEHIILVTVENKFGVLSRIAGLFSGRGFNIESLSVAPTLDPSMSQMTIVTSGDERIVEQIVKQLNKLIDVIKVVDLNESDFVSRETALIKVHTRQEDRAEALRIADTQPTVVGVGIGVDGPARERVQLESTALRLRRRLGHGGAGKRRGRKGQCGDEQKQAGDGQS